jgi:acetyl-CoA carboxylase biotin carboxyl carrier protein
MDMNRIQELLELMKKNGLRVLEVEEQGHRYKFEREGTQTVPVMVPAVVPQAVQHAAAPVPGGAQPAKAAVPVVAEGNMKPIKSPMVGTFYRAPAPDAEPFVKVGDHVTADTVVCLVEAMKVMNEITAECSGTIRKITVENAQPVEFGQVMFLVEPD